MENNESIFKVLKPEDNTFFSKLNSSDLLDLMILLEEYYLEYRENLDLRSDVTFGLELEFEHSNNVMINTRLKSLGIANRWPIKPDITLFNGGEIASPILRDKKETWLELKKVCDILNKYAKIGENSGGHIHIGSHVLGSKKDSWLNFIKFWAAYENIIFRFSYGEYLTERPNIMRYASPLALDFFEDCEKISDEVYNATDLIYLIDASKLRAVSFRKVYDLDKFSKNDTIEFRCSNGTLNPIIWQNNVNFFAKILKYAKSTSFDQDIVTKRFLKLKDENLTINLYDEINLDQALELCDLLFTNNRDKIYFLRQYLKEFKIETMPFVKAKKFTL